MPKPRRRHRAAPWTGWQHRTRHGDIHDADPTFLTAIGDSYDHEWNNRAEIATDERVYVIRCGRFVKIGTSRNVAERLRALQTGNAERVELVGVLYGGNHLEGTLHRRFARHHVRGEWFTLRVLPDLLDMIRGDEAFYRAA